MSPAAPQFMFDFGSPNAFLSHEAILAIEQRTGVKFEYIPVLLGGIFKATNNKSPAETLAGVKNKREFHVRAFFDRRDRLVAEERIGAAEIEHELRGGWAHGGLPQMAVLI